MAAHPIANPLGENNATRSNPAICLKHDRDSFAFDRNNVLFVLPRPNPYSWLDGIFPLVANVAKSLPQWASGFTWTSKTLRKMLMRSLWRAGAHARHVRHLAVAGETTRPATAGMSRSGSRKNHRKKQPSKTQKGPTGAP